ncbi:MAG: MASE1 domain-containing protein [Chitinispirillaceae bacterium]|nr:MASE1 domain-containing protein [Chitinispirillaceae bacterium]
MTGIKAINPANKRYFASTPIIILMVALGYAVVAKVSFLLTIPPGNISPVFPAAGMALAAGIIIGRHALPGVWLGSFVANLLSFMDGTVSPAPTWPIGIMMALFIGFGAMCGVAAGVKLVGYFCANGHPLQSGLNVMILVMIGGAGCSIISPTFGVLSLLAGLQENLSWAQFGNAWLTWWAGDATGVLIAAPLVLAWAYPYPASFRWNPLVSFEALVLGAATLLCCYFVFFMSVPFQYGILPLLLWAAFRFGMRGVSLTAVAITVLAVSGTSMSLSPFVGRTANESILLLNSFFGVTITSALFLAGLMEERRRTTLDLQELNITLKGSEERLRLLGDNLPDSYVYQCMYDEDGTLRFLYCSAGVEKLHGVKAEEVLRDGTLIWRQIPPEQAKVLTEAEKASLQSMTDLTMEARMDDIDGNERWLRLCSRPRKGLDNRILWNGVVTDITTRKHAEEALRASEKKYRDLVMLANSIILRWSRDGRITFLNEFGQRFFGYTSDEIVGRHVIGTIVPENETSGRNLGTLMDEICADPHSFERNINENMRHNGERVWIDWTNKVVLDGHGQIREIMSIGSDITARKRAQDELEHYREHLEEQVEQRTRELAAAKDRAEAADRIKSTFLATMSHELRTPLNSVIGFTGILLQQIPGKLNPEQQKQLGMIQNSARHLLSLINDVLDISKIEAGQFTIEMKPFDVRGSAEVVLESVKELARTKGLDLVAELSSDLEPILGDRRRYEQILLNLLCNAIKFTETGTVTLAVRLAEGDMVETTVRDTGVGIKPSEQEAIFQPFHQVENGTSRRHEGTGLGLSISYRLVEMMGGKIRVSSRYSEGSTFTFTLPMAKINGDIV